MQVSAELFWPPARTFFRRRALQQFLTGDDDDDAPKSKERIMDGQIIGLVAVIMSLGIPLGAMYTYYRVRKLRSEERMAAIAKGVDIPMVAELSESARSRRSGILLVTGAIGWILAFGLIARIEREPDTWVAAAVGVIPLAVGIGYFLDATLIRRDLHPTS
jgi:hypothetical protein